MKPRLYNKNHSWKYNGYGFLNSCYNCETTQDNELNYDTELKILPTDRLYDTLETGLLVRIKPNHTDATQFFEINDIKVNNQGVATVKASHIKRNFFNNLIKYESISGFNLNGTAEQIKTQLLSNALVHRNWRDTSNTDHSFSDIVVLHGYDNTTKSMNIKPPATFEEAFLGDNGFIKTFGGEFRFKNEQIYIYKERGSFKPVTLRFGSGLSDYDQEMNNDDTYDAVVSFAKVKGDNDKYYVVVNGYPVDKYNELADAILGTDFDTRIYLDDCSSALSDITYETAGDSLTIAARQRVKDSLYTFAMRYYLANERKLTQGTVNVKVTSLSELRKLQKVGLYDSVKIRCSNNTVITERVSKVVYDSLNERYISHEFGDKKISLKDFIKIK